MLLEQGKKHDVDQIGINKEIMSGSNLLQITKFYFNQVQMAPFFSAAIETTFYKYLW